MVAAMHTNGLFVGYQTASDPTDEDWMKFVQLTNLCYGHRNKLSQRSRALILSDGGKPAAHHRKILERAHEIGGNPRNDVAILTDVMAAPAIVNVLVLLGPMKHTKFFRSNNIDSAMQHIGIQRDKKPWLRDLCGWLVTERQAVIAKRLQTYLAARPT